MTKRLIILLFFVPVLAFSQNISVKNFRVLADDMDARVNHPKEDQNGDKCAIIKMVTSEQGFMFEGDMNGIVKSEYKTGEYWIYVPYGSKKITIKHPDLGVLRNYVYTLPIKEATVYEMVLTTAQIVTTLVEQEVKTSWVVFESTPTGADVYIDETWVGTTPYQKKLAEGSYNYRLEKSMYHNTAGKFDVTGDEGQVPLKISLNPAFGYANIATSPENGATILIDGREVTQLTPYLTERLKSGTHSVTVKKEMFQPQTVQFTVTDNDTVAVLIDMAGNFATVELYSNPEADLYIDGQKVGNGTYKGRVLEGFHSFEGRRDKHTASKSQKEVVSGENVIVNLNPVPRLGTIDVVSYPIGAQVYINNKSYGTTPTTIKDMLIGDYSVRLTKDGFGDVVKEVTIVENKNVEVNEKLPTGLQITFSSTPSGADVYIDGQKAGISPLTKSVNYGSHVVEVSLKDAMLTEQISVVQGGKNKYSFAFSGEEFDWLDLQKSPSLSGYQSFLKKYPSGKYSAQAKDEVTYLEAKETNTIQAFENYLSSYPSGKYVKDANSTLKYNYIRLADEYYAKGQYSSAKDYYRRYLNRYRYESKASYASERISSISKKEKKSGRNNVFYGYMSYFYSKSTPLSLYGEWMSGNSLGGYFGVRTNTDIFTSGTYYEVDENGNPDDDAVFDNQEPTGEIRYGKFIVSGGINFRLFHPLWMYTGVGIGYCPEFWEMDKYYDDGDYYETEWVKNSDLSTWEFPLEIGLKLCFKGFNLGYGMNINMDDFSTTENSISLGINF